MREIHPVLERLARAIADDSRDSYDNYLPWPVAVSHARAAVQALMEPDEGMVDRGAAITYEAWVDVQQADPGDVYLSMLRPLVEGEGE